MSLNKEKGITLVALIITIILMIILAGTGVYLGDKAIDKAKLEDIKTDMLSIKTKAKIIAEQYNFKDIETLTGTKYNEEAEYDKNNVDQAFSDFTDEQKENLYILKEEDLANMGLNTIKVNSSSFYIVYYNLEDTNSCEIYYSVGYDGKYSLSDLNSL